MQWLVPIDPLRQYFQAATTPAERGVVGNRIWTPHCMAWVSTDAGRQPMILPPGHQAHNPYAPYTTRGYRRTNARTGSALRRWARSRRYSQIRIQAPRWPTSLAISEHSGRRFIMTLQAAPWTLVPETNRLRGPHRRIEPADPRMI
jgi:hypothetical protein